MLSKALLWVALGGSIGAVSRFLVSTWLFVPDRFPWATLVINIAGSLAIGVLWGLGHQQPWFDSWGRYLLVVGLLGGFTTFSAFSLETVAMIDGQRYLQAIGYVFGSMLVCIVAAWAGQRFSGI